MSDIEVGDTVVITCQRYESGPPVGALCEVLEIQAALADPRGPELRVRWTDNQRGWWVWACDVEGPPPIDLAHVRAFMDSRRGPDALRAAITPDAVLLAERAAETLTAAGWRRSVTPNTYLPKPVSVWVRSEDGLHALVHRGRVDLSSDAEVVLGSDTLRAFADLADAPVEDAAPTESKVPVRILVWNFPGPAIYCLAWHGDIDWALRWCDPSSLLADAYDLHTEKRRLGVGLWVWEGIATVLSGATSEPDTINLTGDWRRPMQPEALALMSGADVFAVETS